jgi:hypothetical protein
VWCVQFPISRSFSALLGNVTFELSWPASPAGFVLERTESLTTSIAWQPLTNGITENGGVRIYTVTNQPGVVSHLYHLQLP